MYTLNPLHLTILLAISGVLQADEPALCKLEDEVCVDDILSRVVEKVVAGIPSLNIEPADPMFFDFVDSNLSIINYKLTNNTIKGYSLCKFKNIKSKLHKSTLNIEFECPKDTKMKGDYDVDGKFTNWQIKREGVYDFYLGAFNVNINAVVKMIQREDGKIYLKIKDFIAKFKVVNPITARFYNKFTGENSANHYDKDNWQGFADLIQEPLLMSSFKKIFRGANVYLKTLLFDETEAFN